MIILLVKYICKPGCREDFLSAIKEKNIDELSRNEKGNIRYEYSFSTTDENVLFLTELWENREVLKAHSEMPHFGLLGELKPLYVENTEIERFEGEPFKV